jgi:hypothetical protein
MTVRTIEIGNEEFSIQYIEESGNVLSVMIQMHDGICEGMFIPVDFEHSTMSFRHLIESSVDKDRRARGLA